MCSKKIKRHNVKALNMITNKDKAKAMTEHIHVFVIANSMVQHVIQNKNGIIKQVNVNVRIFLSVYSLNPSTCICENSKYLKSVADTSVTKFDESVIVINNLSTKKTNAITTNVMSSALTITFLIAVSLCFYLIKYQPRQLLPFH